MLEMMGGRRGLFFVRGEVFGGANDLAEGVEDADVSAGTLGEFRGQDRRVELDEEGIEAEDGDTKAGAVKEGGVFLVYNRGGEIEPESHFLEPRLFAEPVLEAAGIPTGEASFIQEAALFAERADDGAVGGAVAEHEIEAFSKVRSQTGDFAMAPDGAGLKNRVGRRSTGVSRVHREWKGSGV